MVPSPELGQPKAPDKISAASGNSSHMKRNPSDASFTNHMATVSDSPANCNSVTTSAIIISNNTPVAPSIPSVAPEKSSKNLRHWKDYELKELLDEAYSYKNPKDRENKSETFLQLLAKVEREKDNHFPAITGSRYQRGSSSHKHGGSLQDLAEATTNDILDSDYSYGKSNRRHHHNSRTKKYSLVSSRQREGGSLPSNVNASNCNLSIYEPPFLNEVGSKRRNKNERTCSGTSCASGTSGTSSTVSTSGQDSVTSSECKDDSSSGENTVTEGGDGTEDGSQKTILIQGKHNPVDIDVGVEVHATMNLQATLEISYPETKHSNWVDDTVSFPSLERGKSTIDATCALTFDDSSKSCQSVLGEKPENPKPAIFQTSKVITSQVDENGNALVSKKKKKGQSDRNTTTLNIQSVEGYRGRDTIASLVKFIESKKPEPIETVKKPDKVIPVVGKKKEKKKEKDIKKDIHKVKKSTSLEELRSCTKLDEDEKLESGVTMRAKGKKSGIALMGGSNDGKEMVKQHSKRGERRSWGTEELTYLGENNAIEEVREKNKEREKSKKSKETLEKQEKFDNIETTEPKKWKNERSLSVLSIESVQSETAEFHVVTKKKRSKKRQSFEETRPVDKMNSLSSRNSASGHKKYQSSSSFSNDRDAYLSAYNPHDSRRKSTSSVPPSEKSDSSDLDSVHSLPIESTSNRHHTSSSQMQHQSYADIARTVNLNNQYTVTSPPIDKMDKWPIVSSNLSNTTGQSTIGIEITNNTSQASSNKTRPLNISKSKSLIKDFPDLVTDRTISNHDGASSCSSSSSSTSTIVKQMSYSQSLGDDRHVIESVKTSIKSLPLVTAIPVTKLADVIKSNDINKQTLQKSKSVENESYCNIDQYPALIKTVKRHVTQNPIIETKPQTPIVTSMLVSTSLSLIKQQRSSSSSIQHQQQALSLNIGPSSCPITTNTITIPSNISSSSDNKSKIVVNNFDINTNTAATSSSSNINIANSSSINLNIGKKSKNNAKIIESSPLLVEVNNAKNTKQQHQQHLQQTNPTSAADVITIGGIQNSSSSLHSKKNKSDLQQIDGNPISRKTKRDKNQNSLNNSNSHGIGERQQASVSVTRNSNRPAVIILNDISDSTLCTKNDFTFGDFNEEELRLFENSSQPLDDSGNFNVTVQDVCSSSSITSDLVHDDTHLSPRSDLGYSSSNNRSIFSESIEGKDLAGILPNKLVTPGCELKCITTTSSTPNTATDFRQLLNNTSTTLFPNDSAIIIVAQNCLTSQNSQQQPQQSVITNLLTTTSSSDKKVLSNNSSNSNIKIISNKTKDKNNELINYETHITGNNNIINSSSSDNVNINNNNNTIEISTNSSTIASTTITNSSCLDKFIEVGIIVDGKNNNCSKNSSATSAAGTANKARNTGTIQKTSCDNNNMKKFSKKEINIRFIAPPIAHDIDSINYEKMVDFVGLAWEDILHGVNGETEFYDGQ